MPDPVVLKALVVKLLLAVQGLTGYGAPEQPPNVEFRPQSVLQEEACGHPCNVLGWFPPGDTIYLDERLDPVADLRARGILVHELVHYLQQENGSLQDGSPCTTWLAREREAFDVQIRWLTEQNAPLSAFSRFRRVPLQVSCGPEDDTAG